MTSCVRVSSHLPALPRAHHAVPRTTTARPLAPLGAVRLRQRAGVLCQASGRPEGFVGLAQSVVKSPLYSRWAQVR
jgi:hypothetical protein